MTFHQEIASTFEDVDAASANLSVFLINECSLQNNKLMFLIVFTIKELLNNAVEHGNKMDKNKKVIYDFSCTQEEICIDIYDEGKGYKLDDILQKSDMTIDRERSRGIILIREIGFNLFVNANHVQAKYRLV